MAMLIQTLSAKLGHRDRPEPARRCAASSFSRRTSFVLWLQAEAIAMATDLAEFLGAAIGFHLLLGIDLFPAAVHHRRSRRSRSSACSASGFRPLEATIAAIVGVIGVCYLAEIFYAEPAAADGRAARGRAGVPGRRVDAARGRHPRRDGDAARDLPALGADAGPDRPRDTTRRRSGCCATRASTSIIAMSIAGLINMAMLVMAASVVLRERPARRRLARGRAQDARADPRRRVEQAVRARAARLRARRARPSGRWPARS